MLELICVAHHRAGIANVPNRIAATPLLTLKFVLVISSSLQRSRCAWANALRSKNKAAKSRGDFARLRVGHPPEFISHTALGKRDVAWLDSDAWVLAVVCMVLLPNCSKRKVKLNQNAHCLRCLARFVREFQASITKLREAFAGSGSGPRN